MASYTLFPPIVDNYINTFQIKGRSDGTADPAEYCKVYFSLSDFNAISDIESVQAVVYHKNSNKSVVKPSDDDQVGDEQHFRTTGVILNLAYHKEAANLYYVKIYNRDLNSDYALKHINPAVDESNSSNYNQNETIYNGQIPGEIYKIQLRLSSVNYDPSNDGSQEQWVKQHAGDFSQQSRVCVVKPIGKTWVTIPLLDFNSDNDEDPYTRKTIYSSTYDIIGKFYEAMDKEKLYSFNIQIYKGTDTTGLMLEDSGEQFTNNWADPNEFKYLCKTEFEDMEYYTMKFKFTTQNQFVYETQAIILVSLAYVDLSGISIYTVEDNNGITIPSAAEDTKNIYESVRNALNTTSIGEEQEEGRIALKLFSYENSPFYGNFYVRRASSKDNFKYWYDIKLITVKDKKINDIPMFYDYTIESGVQYQYGVQYIDNDGYRGILYKLDDKYVKREFEYSFLLGKNNQQLKLMFDNTMQNYKIQVSESKTETIGSQFPRATKNGAVKYKIFPITGLISAQMDENKTFCTKKDIYSSEEVLAQYEKWEQENYLNVSGYDKNLSIPQDQYNYTYERDFRDKVLEFLHDGEPKLFKSPTEGNVIVRLMDVACTPNQSLDRMLYSFSANGNELAANTIENYVKYNFIDLGDIEKNLIIKKTLIGQLYGEFGAEDNIFKLIAEKHDRSNDDFGGYNRDLINIHHVRITFEDKPLRIEDANGLLTVGNNISINGNLITVTNPLRMYTFDERLEFSYKNGSQNNDSLFLLPDQDQIDQIVNSKGELTGVEKVAVTIDYLYDVEDSPYVGKIILSKKLDTYVGQFYERCEANDSIYDKIASRYYTDWEDRFTQLNSLSSVEIEAQPGMVIWIRDQQDPVGNGESHVINESGVLNLSRIANITGLKVKGIYEKETNTINTVRPKDQDWDILVNYHCTVLSGTYDVDTGA